MSLLATLRTKKPTAAVTLNFQIQPDIATQLECAATRSNVPRYDICRVLIEQGLISLLKELDEDTSSEVSSSEVSSSEATSSEVASFDEAGIAA